MQHQAVHTDFLSVVVPVERMSMSVLPSDMIKELCNKKNISVSELARRIGQTPQNFGKKLKRDTVSLEELKQIADVMEVIFEQSFIFPDGEQIKIGS